MKTCCICGNEVTTDDELYINGKTAPICTDCGNLLDRLETSGKTDPHRENAYKLLQSKMQNNNANVKVIEAISEIYKQEDSAESDRDHDIHSESESFFDEWNHESRFSTASGKNLPYVVMQVTLKEKLLGTGSRNLTDLEDVINAQVAKGYRLHTMSTSNGGSKGIAGGDRIQATLVFERLDMIR